LLTHNPLTNRRACGCSIEIDSGHASLTTGAFVTLAI